MKRTRIQTISNAVIMGFVVFFLVGCNIGTTNPAHLTWDEKVSAIRWIAYSPTNADPNKGVEPTVDSIKQDLIVLRSAGFTGLVTYSATGVMGKELPQLANELGFQGFIIGVWDIKNQDEILAAKGASNNSIVLGYCVGNEGLHKRYEMSELSSVIKDIQTATGKPVTTTEEIDDYSDETLLKLGDWIFPNAHPYFHSQTDPEMAVRWTNAAFKDMTRRADGRFVMFKEVGLPTEGDKQGQLSEENQRKYYQELAKTDVKFVYFEAFDMTWKTTLPIEPHWGIFYSDRSPKIFASDLISIMPTPTIDSSVFYIYKDIDFQGNHFKPSGYMGDIGDISINEANTDKPHSGKTSIQITYIAEGKAPNNCDYVPPCKWAGVYWQEPPNNWGKDVIWKDSGFDLSAYNHLRFWARAEKNIQVEFKVGGIIGTYGDSLEYPRGIVSNLKPEWQEFDIDLSGADLSHTIGGFVWVLNIETIVANGILDGKVVFYLDDIRFEH
jgi:exo-beta-1,3-glucanase (GH17 family)